MVVFNTKDWVNFPQLDTPITAEELKRIEQGIADVVGAVLDIVAAEGWVLASPVEWDANTEYPPRMIVDDDGGYFVSLVTTTGDKPTTSPTKWHPLPTAIDAEFRSDANHPDTGFVRKPDADAAIEAYAVPLIHSPINIAQRGASPGKTATENHAIIQSILDDIGAAGLGAVEIPTSDPFRVLPLIFHGGTHIAGKGPDSVLKLGIENPSGVAHYSILRSVSTNQQAQIHDVSIANLTLDGNRTEIAAGNTDAQGRPTWPDVPGDGNAFGIRWSGVVKGAIDDVWAHDIYTDALYIGGGQDTTDGGGNVTQMYPTEDLVAHNFRAVRCGRQGVSIVQGKRIVLARFDIDTVDRTLPRAGIDLEPNGRIHSIDDITLRDWKIRNARAGVIVSTVSGSAVLDGNPNVNNITVQGVEARGISGNFGFALSGPASNVEVSDYHLYDYTGTGNVLLIQSQLWTGGVAANSKNFKLRNSTFNGKGAGAGAFIGFMDDVLLDGVDILNIGASHPLVLKDGMKGLVRNTRVITPTYAPARAFAVLDTADVTLLDCGTVGTSHQHCVHGAAATVIGGNWRKGSGNAFVNTTRVVDAVVDGVPHSSMFTKAGVPVDADFPGGARDGMHALDSTNHRMYVRSGGTWRYAPLT